MLRCIAATKRLGSPRVLFTVIRFCGRLMQLIQGDVSLRLRLREERDAWRDVHVVDGPIRYHQLWRGSLMETAESDRGAVVAGLAAAPMRCVAASSDGASASSLFEDPEGMLAVATMIPGIDIVRLQAEAARLEARASHVCTLRDFRTGPCPGMGSDARGA